MASVVLNESISMIVSSDPNAGATNRDALGSYFEVNLQDGLKIPKDAMNVEVSVEESAIWWVVPNIITGVNDTISITGPAAGNTFTGTDLGYNMGEVNIVMTTGPSQIALSRSIGEAPMPTGKFKVGDSIRFDSGALSGNSYEITQVVSDTDASQIFNIATTTDTLPDSNYDFTRVRPNGVILETYNIVIDKGLYDLGGLNQAILRELENEKAQIDPNPLIVLSADEPTQRVEIRFNYDNVSVNFGANSPYEILGFLPQTYGPYATAPINVVADNVAKFNQVNYFLIHSDLVSKGIRFNDTYNQTIAQVLIDVPPGSQIVSKPFNPARTDADELKGITRSILRFWITDENNNRIDTNEEYWSARIVIKYQKVLVLDKNP